MLICEMAAREWRDPRSLGSSQHIMVNTGRDARNARDEAEWFLDTYYTTSSFGRGIITLGTIRAPGARGREATEIQRGGV